MCVVVTVQSLIAKQADCLSSRCEATARALITLEGIDAVTMEAMIPNDQSFLAADQPLRSRLGV